MGPEHVHGPRETLCQHHEPAQRVRHVGRAGRRQRHHREIQVSSLRADRERVTGERRRRGTTMRVTELSGDVRSEVLVVCKCNMHGEGDIVSDWGNGGVCIRVIVNVQRSTENGVCLFRHALCT